MLLFFQVIYGGFFLAVCFAAGYLGMACLCMRRPR